MEIKNKIVCPECRMYTLDTQMQINAKRCAKCGQRYDQWLSKEGRIGYKAGPYVAIGDMVNTNEYKDFKLAFNKYIKKKALMEQGDKLRKNKQSKPETKRNRLGYFQEVKNFMRGSDFDYENKTAVEIQEFIQQNFPEYTISRACVYKALKELGYDFARKEAKFTDEIVSDIRQFAKDKTRLEIVDYCNKKYPELNMDEQCFYNTVRRYKIDYVRRDTRGQLMITQEVRDNAINNITEVEPEVIDQKANEKIYNIDAEKEVSSVFEKVCKEQGCGARYQYTVDQTIMAFNVIMHLYEYYPLYLKNGAIQNNILNAYMLDMWHEIENADSTNPEYLIGKAQCLRDIRRTIKDQQNIINIVKPIIEIIKKHIKIEELESIRNKLAEEKIHSTNIEYVPKVDFTQYEKYDWALQAPANKKTLSDPLLKNRIPSSEKLFRASFKISGSGNGTFTSKFRDISASSLDEAKVKFNNYIKTELGPNVLVTDVIYIEQNK